MEEDLASQLESRWSDHYGDDYPFPVVMPKKDSDDQESEVNDGWTILEDDEHTTTDTKENL